MPFTVTLTSMTITLAKSESFTTSAKHGPKVGRSRIPSHITGSPCHQLLHQTVDGFSLCIRRVEARGLTGALKLTGGLPLLNNAEREHRTSERVDAGVARSLTLVR